MSTKTFCIQTLGCRINFYESQAIREQLSELGYRECRPQEETSLMLIHSCAVTATAEKKVRALISRALAKKERCGCVLCVFGCMAQKYEKSLYDQFPKVDLFWGNAELEGLVATCDALVRGIGAERSFPKLPNSYDTPPISAWYSPRAFVKIQDGCNSFCTYCIVPYLRGRQRNRDVNSILTEVKTLVAGGAREIVLSGIETAAFGSAELLSLASAIAEIEGVERIRFGSLKPSLFTAEFCRVLSENEKIMPQFHLSVQSASTRVLERMGRKYTREQLYAYIDNLRGAIDHVAITADLICGFPGETPADFEDTVSFVRDARLLHAHVFPYSKREGTRAASFEGQLSQEEKKRRAALLTQVAEEVHNAEVKRILPLEKHILVERFRGGNALGHSEHFLELSLPRNKGDRVGMLKSIKE